MTETGTRTTDSTAVYDQYEVSVPLQHAGDCLALVTLPPSGGFL